MKEIDSKIPHESENLETLLNQVLIDTGFGKYLFILQFTTWEGVWASYLAKGFTKEIEIDTECY